MEHALSVFLQYGIVGAVALLALLGYIQERRENKKLRDVHAAQLEDIHKGHASQLAAQGALFAESAAQSEAAHREQEDELTDRLVNTVEKQAENQGRLSEKVTLFMDAVRKKGD